MSPSLRTQSATFLRHNWKRMFLAGIFILGLAPFAIQLIHPTGFRGFMDENRIGQRLSLAYLLPSE